MKNTNEMNEFVNRNSLVEGQSKSSRRTTFNFKLLTVNCILFLCCLLFGSAAWGQANVTVTIGDGTSYSNKCPICTYYNYSITEQLYTASEIGMAGTIQKISFYYSGTAAKDYPIEVFMKEVDAADLSSGISLSDATSVFNGTLSTTTTEGWVTITLGSPFDYSGTKNLLIGINKGYVYYFSGSTWQYSTTSSTMARYTENDGSAYTTSTTPGSTTNRPNIKLEITPLPCVTLTSPANGAEINTDSPTLQWDAATGATSYHIYLSNTTTKPAQYSYSTSSTSVTASNIPYGVTYCWLVPCDGNGELNSCDDYTYFRRTCPANIAAPTITANADLNNLTCGQTVTLTATGEYSDYRWYSDAACTTQVGSGQTYSFPAGNSSITIYCKSACVSAPAAEVVQPFVYTGSEQTWNVPAGVSEVKLEVWGAQGGYRSSSTYGGKGGYSVGTYSSTPGQTLYVVVGGSGNTGGTSGGYNGGGSRGTYNGGGGATHIATATGVLSGLSGNTEAVLIVAGGGGSDGGSSYSGGAGGGTNGIAPSGGYGTAGGVGTQSAGGTGGNGNSGSFGQGGAGAYASSGYAGAGGGGWYGGGGSYPDGSVDDDLGGAGGSGYIGGVSDAQTIAGNAEMPNPAGGTMTGREGNGYARISYSTPEESSLSSAASITASAAPAPATPTVSVASACRGDDVVLTVTNAVNGLNYGWWDNSSCTGDPLYEGASFTINNMQNDATYYVRAYSGSMNPVHNFDYTGDVQTVTVPAGASSAVLEVWGAQGGYRSSSSYGGKGGYSIGTINSPTAGQTLYVVVGGSGNTGGTSGGYNGGGSRETYNGGGGATHIATATGVLSALSGNTETVLIVAGGGGSDGGSSYSGGAGGGTNGIAPSGGYGTAGGVGTQSAGGTGGNGNSGSFGQGGAGAYASSGYAGAGGGGWYGGGGSYPDGSVDDDLGGAGGSGYIKNTLADAQTIAGNTSFSAPNGGTETGHEGDGYARITFNGLAAPACMSAIRTVNVELNALPTFTLDATSSISCDQTPVTFTITNPSNDIVRYEWSDGVNTTETTSTTYTVIPGSTTTYTVSAFNSHCSASQSFTVEAEAPVVTLTGSDNGDCVNAGTDVTLSFGSSNSYTYAWSNNATNYYITVAPTESTSYSVTVTGGGTVCPTIIDYTVRVNPEVEVSPMNPTICAGTTTTLTASGADNYHWNNDALTASITVGGGTYTVTGTNSDGCYAEVSSVVTSHSTPSAGTIADMGVCQSDDVITLASTSVAHGGTSIEYSWTIGSVITTGWSSAETYTLTDANRTALGTGTFTITRTFRDECENTGSTTATLSINLPMDAPTVTGLASIYRGQTTTLTASTSVSGNISYRWYSDAEGQTLVYEGNEFTTPALNATTTYYVQSIETSDVDFDYTGDVQTWVVPAGVTQVQLEVWGAQGGNASVGGSYMGAGGAGGYSKGLYSVSEGNTLYVVVGGQGTSSTSITSPGTLQGGYNGGGNSMGGDTYCAVAAGGGATHISTTSGVLSSLSPSSVIIVAGGGGGAGTSSNSSYTQYGTGGYGGGVSGGTGISGYASYSPGGGGTQSQGGSKCPSSDYSYEGSFGQGGNQTGNSGGWGAGAGGGGYYGGGSGGALGATGGGGSGYIGGVTSGETLAGNESFLAPDGTAETGHTGNGYARITIISGPTANCPSELAPVTITVNAPPIPVVEVNSACVGTPSELEVTNPVDGYTYQWSTASDFSTIEATGVTFTPTLNSSETYYVRSVVYGILQSADFSYTESVQNWNVPAGITEVQLEVWGAQGGYRSSSTYGGKGGYSVGTYSSTPGQTLYVVVGGSGNTGGTSGGYNGGGSRETYNGGGGATHIATATGVLSALSGNTETVLIVAGGGGSDGGSSYSGGAGGGTNGIAPSGGYGTAGGVGTQSAGGTGGNGNSGSFGQGGAGAYASSGYAGAGGGGWYGGGGSYPDGSVDDDLGGAGGSGYIGGVSDGETIAGNTSFPSPEGGSETGHEGDGYARITYLDFDAQTASSSATVTVNPVTPPSFNFTASANTYCNGEPAVVLTAENPSSDITGYQWSDGATTVEPSHTVTPEHTTNYAVTVTNGSCMVYSAPISITVDEPYVSIIGSDNGECMAQGAEVTIGAGSLSPVTIGEGTDAAYYFPIDNFYNYSCTEQIYLASEVGNYGTITTISFYYEYGTSYSASNVTMYMKSVSRSNFSSNTDYEPLASSDIVWNGTLSPTSAGWYTITLDQPFWYDGESNLLIAFYDPTYDYPGLAYTFRQTATADYRGLRYYSDSDSPDPYDLGSYSGNKDVYAHRNNIILGWKPVTYSWSTNSSNSSITVYPTESTTYTLTVTDGEHGCPAIWNYTVKVNPTPTLVTDHTPLCLGDEATLTAGGGETYNWGDGNYVAENDYVVSPTSNTVYYVTVKDANGCTAPININQEVQQAPGNTPMTHVVQGHIWTGRVSSDWDDSRNWLVFTGGGSGYTIAASAPTVNDQVVVRTGGTCINNEPSVNANSTANNVIIRENRTLTVEGSHTLAVNGDIDIENGGALTFSGSGTVSVTGDANIASGASVTFGNKDTLNVAGDFTLRGNLDFPASDTTPALRLGGNLVIDGGSLDEGGTLVFAGNGPQSINNGGTAPTINNNVRLNMHHSRAGVPHTIFPDGTIFSKTTIFEYGIMDGNVTFNETGRAIVCGDYESYASGRITKIGAGNNFTFPTGDDNVLGSVTARIGAGNTVYAKFHHKSSDNGDGTHGFGLDVIPRWWNVADMCGGDPFNHVTNFEYWDISSPVELSDVMLMANAATGAEHFSDGSAYVDADIQVAAYKDNCWNNFGGRAEISGADHNVITIREANIPKDPHRAVADFLITLGSKSKTTVLPIELTSFTATCDGRSALVEWSTASERNNDYFVIERSDDAINFTEIARVAGAGNSIEQLDYTYNDYGIHGGDNYYRLVQVDYDGTRTVSDIVVANCIDTEVGEPEVMAYPNPFNGELTIVLDNFDNRPATIEVYDMLGKLVYIEKAASPQNSYETILNLSNLSPAAYTVRVSTADFVINKQVVKN